MVVALSTLNGITDMATSDEFAWWNLGATDEIATLPKMYWEEHGKKAKGLLEGLC